MKTILQLSENFLKILHPIIKIETRTTSNKIQVNQT